MVNATYPGSRLGYMLPIPPIDSRYTVLCHVMVRAKPEEYLICMHEGPIYQRACLLEHPSVM